MKSATDAATAPWRLLEGYEPVERVYDETIAADGQVRPHFDPLIRSLEALVRAGVDRFNVSVDSLQRDRFYELTRRDALPQVLRGLERLATFPEAHPIKINAVAIRGFTEEETLPFARLARRSAYQVRFIEYMPLDADHAWTPEQVLTGEESRAAIDASLFKRNFVP